MSDTRSAGWLLALVVAFALGLAAGAVIGKPLSRTPEVGRLQQQVDVLQARLRARESHPGLRPDPGAPAPGDARHGVEAGAGRPLSARGAAGALTEERATPGRSGWGAGAAQAGSRAAADAASTQARPGAGGAPAATIQGALDRFYRYLETIGGLEGRERWQRALELVDDLRAMGDVAGQALMQVLSAGSDSDERRAAARLLGTLQIPESVPLLRDIIERDDDVLLRRAAAAGLRRLQTPESVAIMEQILQNPEGDRFVRLSAAFGLAESGRPLGVAALAQIFEESAADGRGRELAFRGLAALNDERSLPFMRGLVTAPVEPAYRLQAIRYVMAQGDRQALAALRLVMQSPGEQPSIRDAAAQAHAALGGS